MQKKLLAFLITAGAATAGQAQQAGSAAQQPPAPEIIVEGSRDQGRQIERFIDVLTPAPVGGQLGKFEGPVCPIVLGLPASEKGLVESRLRTVAAEIGAPVASGECVPNLYVLVAGDKRETLEGLQSQFPHLLAGVPRHAVKRLSSRPGPVASWQIIDVMGSDGMPLSYARMAGDVEPVRIVATVGTPSRITRLTRPHFVGSVLIVEADALDGVSTRQLADFAAMRTLAATDSTQAPLPAESILSLFGGAPGLAPPSVTWWDFAFLKSLYATDNDRPANFQRSAMSRIMEAELAKVPPEER